MAMYNGRRRINSSNFISRLRSRRTNLYQYGINKRRRFIRPRGRQPVYRGSTRYTSRPLGNPLAVTERKYHDLELGGRAIVTILSPGDWSAALTDPNGPNPFGGLPIPAECFNAIPSGYTWQQRIGRKVQILSIKIRMEIGLVTSTVTPASPFVSQLCRFVLYIDKQTNGTVSNPGELLFSGPSNVIGVDYFQNGSSFGRYKILIDKTFTLNPHVYYNYSSNTTSNNGNNRFFDINYTFNPPLTVHYNAGLSATVADIIDNSIHLCCGTDQNNPQCFMSYKSRVTFFDS